jgi:chromosome segregation ATPase
MASNLKSKKESAADALARIESERGSLLAQVAGIESRRGVIQARLSRTLPWFEFKRLKDEEAELRADLGEANRRIALLNQERKALHASPAVDADARKTKNAALFAVAEAAYDFAYGDGDEEELGAILDAAFDRLDEVCPDWSRGKARR